MLWKKYAPSKAKELADLTDEFTKCGLLSVDEDPDAWFARLVNICLHLEDIGNKGEYKKKNFEINAHILNQLPYNVYCGIILYLRRDVNTLSLDAIEKIIRDQYKMIYAIHLGNTGKGPNHALPVLQQPRLPTFQR